MLFVVPLVDGCCRAVAVFWGGEECGWESAILARSSLPERSHKVVRAEGSQAACGSALLKVLA